MLASDESGQLLGLGRESLAEPKQDAGPLDSRGLGPTWQSLSCRGDGSPRIRG